MCQIEGVYVPVADMKLAADDWVYFTHNVLLWKDPQVNISAMSLKGAWKRLMGGLPLIMTQAQGPGHIAFSQDGPGELIALPLQPGQSIDVREHLFLAATGNVHYDWFQTNIWFQTRNGNDTETHYPLGQVMDRFGSAQAPGCCCCMRPAMFSFGIWRRTNHPGEAHGAGFQRPQCRWPCTMNSRAQVSSSGFEPDLLMAARLAGPGRIAIQSVFDRIEGEGEYHRRFAKSDGRFRPGRGNCRLDSRRAVRQLTLALTDCAPPHSGQNLRDLRHRLAAVDAEFLPPQPQRPERRSGRATCGRSGGAGPAGGC